MTDLERICRAVIGDIFDGVDWRYANAHERNVTRAVVRGVLKAVREPGDDATIAGLRKRYPSNLYNWQALPAVRQTELLAEMRGPFQAMIDHLLEE